MMKALFMLSSSIMAVCSISFFCLNKLQEAIFCVLFAILFQMYSNASKE